MRIAIDASRANLINKTGTEWYSYHLIQELKKIIPNKHQVILYSKENLHNDLAILPTNWTSRVLNWPARFFWTQIRLSWEMLHKKNRADILFIPAHTIPIIHPRKTILVAHDIGFQIMPKLYPAKDLLYHRFAMRYAINHADQIITVSNFSKKEIVDFYHCDVNKIHVVYNGFNNLNDYQTNDHTENILQKNHIKKPYLLFVGRLEEKKNTLNLVKAFHILKNKYKIPHKLVLIGMPGYNYAAVRKYILENNLSVDVIELGYVAKSDLKIIMSHAELFIFPSLYEGFGIPILEAMAVGTPVVCSNIPPLQEVGAEAAVYFDPHNEKNMAEEINKLINDDEQKKYLINLGYQRIKKFSYQICAQNTWKIISQYDI